MLSKTGGLSNNYFVVVSLCTIPFTTALFLMAFTCFYHVFVPSHFAMVQNGNPTCPARREMIVGEDNPRCGHYSRSLKVG